MEVLKISHNCTATDHILASLYFYVKHLKDKLKECDRKLIFRNTPIIEIVNVYLCIKI